MRILGGCAPLLAALGMMGCAVVEKIPVHMDTKTEIRHSDGTVERKETHWKGTLNQLPAQLGKAGEELGADTAKMAKELTDVPPPGQVTLSSLSPALAKYEGRKGVDFLADAKNPDGTPIDFKYVRLGQPSYDDFFRTAQEVYALCYQTKGTVHRLREATGAVLNEKVAADATLKAQVDQALGAQASADVAVIAEIKELAEIGSSLGPLATQLASKLAQLATTGEALISGAASSLTNPKVVAHLGLVKDGLLASVNVIKESVPLMGKLSTELSGFVSG